MTISKTDDMSYTLHSICKAATDSKYTLVKVRIIEFILLLKQKFLTGDEKRKEPILTKDQYQIAVDVRDFISKNYQKEISIENIAKEYYISETSLKQMYQKQWGTTIAKDIRKMRMNQACGYLLSEELSIAEISKKCGYSNPSKFAAAFKKAMGVSPHIYKKNGRLAQENGSVEERTLEISEMGGTCICNFLPDYHLLFVDDALCRLTGYPTASLLDMKFCDLFFEEDQRLLEETIKKIDPQNLERNIICRIQTANNSFKYMTWTLRGIVGYENQILGYQAEGRVSREKGHSVLNIDTDDFFSLLDMIPACVSVSSPDYTIRYANHMHNERYGAAEGKKCYELLWNRDKPCEKCRVKTVFVNQKVAEWECVYDNGDIEQVFCFPLQNEDGELLNFQIFIKTDEVHKQKTNVVKLDQLKVDAPKRQGESKMDLFDSET